MKTLKHFYNLSDYSLEEVHQLIDLALKYKKGPVKKSLIDKALAMLFFNPSLRTKTSFTVAMQKLGGITVDLMAQEGGCYTFEFKDGVIMNKDTIEHVKEAARVLSRYCSAIAIRASKLVTNSRNSVKVDGWEALKEDEIIRSFMNHSAVPVINMESNVYHPCQGLGDAVTIKEKLGKTRQKKYVMTWVYHPKALPMATPNSQIMGACDLGMDVVVVCPSGWELDNGILEKAEKRAREAGGSLAFSNNQKEAIKGAHIVCAKSWGALKYYGHWDKEKEAKRQLTDWIVDTKKMSLTDNAYFMHCLPVRRNVEVTDDVIDGKNSIVSDQAENRMWTQMSILSSLL